MKPRIGITIGDPAGVGPEIVRKALHRPDVLQICVPVTFGDLGVPSNKSFRYGVATAANGKASGIYIEAAIQAALTKQIDAVVTAPINKQSFRMGGWGKKFTGHTEMFAKLTGARRVALMLVHGPLRAVHVTSHIPLKKVASALTVSRVLETILLTHQALRKMGIKNPRIAVCGLNPHAGDGGLLGKEERTVIAPAIRKAKQKKVRAEGPLSADTVWPLVRDGVYDAGVAMYHDQGQIPIKLSSFSSTGKNTLVRGVNVTLGLPIVRTSVAHGTAYEIAGKGKASEESLVDAIKLAAKMAGE